MRQFTRRSFLGSALSALPAFLLTRKLSASSEGKLPAVISTWSFGKPANERAFGVLVKGGSSLDAVEKGINHAELDLEVRSVGKGGLPNEEGEVELDAAIMSGPLYAAGSVASLKHISTPISVARRVMEKTKHVMLVGDGALKFALREGFEKEELLTPESREMWLKWKENPERSTFWKSHDTIGMVAVDENGDVVSGCSTSGLAWKIAGRVGDSPLIGSGLYVDNRVGGSAATGIGEEILKTCASFLVVEKMREGLSPAEATRKVIERIVEKKPENRKIMVALVAVDRQGSFGAFATKKGFVHCVRNSEGSFVKESGSLEE